jgi:hypothetical protein
MEIRVLISPLFAVEVGRCLWLLSEIGYLKCGGPYPEILIRL